MARTKKQMRKHAKRLSNPGLSPTEQARRAYNRQIREERDGTAPAPVMGGAGFMAAAATGRVNIRQVITPAKTEDLAFTPDMDPVKGEDIVLLPENDS